MGNTTGCSPSSWRQSFGRQPAHASFLLPTIFPYRPKDDSFGRCPGTGSLNEAAYPCSSRMRGQLARPVLRGARVSNDPRLLDVRPAGRTFLEVKVLYTPGKGKC